MNSWVPLYCWIDQMEKKGLTLKKQKNTTSRWYLAETITDTDYAKDLVLLGNTPAQAESLLHSE